MRFGYMLGLAVASAATSISAFAGLGASVIGLDHELSLTGQARRRGYSSTGRTYGSRSKHRPHIGSKERARHAGWPNGLMHTPTPDLRSNAFKRSLAATPVEAVKPKRKPRAKKAAA